MAFDPSTASLVDGFDPGSASLVGDFDPESVVEIDASEGRSVGDVVGDVGVTALKGAVGLPQAVVGLADLVTGGAAGNVVEGAGVRFEDAQQILDTLYSDPQQEANRKVREAEGFVDTTKAAIENPSVIATSVGESLPQMIGGAGIARGALKIAPKISPVIAGAIGEGAISAGSSAEQIRSEAEDGLLTGKQVGSSIVSGIGTGLLGFAGGKLAQKLGIADIDTVLASGQGQKVAGGFAKQVIGAGISEGAFEELPQSTQEQMWSNYATGKPITEGVGNAAALGMLAGVAMGGAGGGYNAAINRISKTQPEDILTAETTDEAIQKFAESVATEPDAAEQFVSDNIPAEELLTGLDEVTTQPFNPETANEIQPAAQQSQPDMRGAVPVESEIRPAAGTGEGAIAEPVRPAVVDDQLATAQAQRGGDTTGIDASLPDGSNAAVDRRVVSRETEARRSNADLRQQYDSMTPEERAAALEDLHRKAYVSDLTGLQNKRAFEEHITTNPEAKVLYGDVDGLKALNTRYGHNGADQILKAVGEVKAAVASELGVNAFHRSGDEFLAVHHDPAILDSYGAEVQKRLDSATVEVTLPDGTVEKHVGIGLSYGVGENANTAEARAETQKAARKSGAVPVQAAGRNEDQQGVSAQDREELIRTVTTPASQRIVTPQNPPVISAKPAETAQSEQLITESKPVFGTNSAGRITLRGVPMEKIQAVRDKLKIKGAIIGKDSAVFPKGTDLKALQAEFGVVAEKPQPKAKPEQLPKEEPAAEQVESATAQAGNVKQEAQPIAMMVMDAPKFPAKHDKAITDYIAQKYRIEIVDEGYGPAARVTALLSQTAGKEMATIELRVPVEVLEHRQFAKVNNAAKRLFDSAKPDLMNSGAKKLEVLKAQAQGKISGDQGAALKELADAGEHAAVDEVLKTSPAANLEKAENIKQESEKSAAQVKPVEKSAENVQNEIDQTGGVRFSKSKPVDQTNTPEFKKWFGDSKVVDADGNPLVVYHGSSATFNVFDIGKLNSRNEGPGFYFTTSKDVAGGYVNRDGSAGQLVEAYLSLRKPMAYDQKPLKGQSLQKLVKRIADIESEAEGIDIRDGFLSNFADTYDQSVSSAVREAADLIASDDTAVDQISGIVGSGVSAKYVLQAVTDVTGYDGIVSTGFSNEGDTSNTIYVAFRPEQIKSATGNIGTFDPANPDILFSQSQSTARNPYTITTLRSAINEAMGKGFAELLEATEKFKIISSEQVAEYLEGSPDSSFDKSGRILAFVTGGKTYFVADNISSDDSVKGLLHHELGVHALQLGRTDEEFQGILKRIESMRKMGDKRVKAAFARVPNDTPAHLVTEEAAGYLAEMNADMPIVRKFVDRLRALLRSIGRALPVMQRAKWFQWASNLKVEEILYMAQQATKRTPHDLSTTEDRGTFKSNIDFERQKAQTDINEVDYEQGRTTSEGLRSGLKGKNLRTISGGIPREGWSEGTRITRGGEPFTVHRGSEFPLESSHFEQSALGRSTGHPSSGLGVWFTSHHNEASKYGNVESFKLDIRNPAIIKAEDLPGDLNTVDDYYALREEYRAKGNDGLVIHAKHLGKPEIHFVAFDPEQVISEKTLFSRRSDLPGEKIVGNSGREYTKEQIDAMQRTGSVVTKKTIKDIAGKINSDVWKRMAQGLADQFRPVKDIDEHAYTLLRLSKGATGAFEAFMQYGKLSIKDGATDADKTGGVLDNVFFPLGKETTDFLRWISGHRAERLKAVGRERLFTDSDIAAFKSLSNGKTDFDYTMSDGTITRDRQQIYADSLKKFNGFSKNVLDIAEQSGLIDRASRALWEHEFYVPFYRVAEEAGKEGEARGMFIKGGVLRQEAFKKLKGGEEQLNDLLANTLMNWMHLIDASAKNRAALATLDAAEKVGAARKAVAGDTKTSWVMKDGQKVEYKVEDPYIVEALSSLEFAGIRGTMMDILSKPKYWLTIGVTASPFFKVRNLIRDSVQAIATASNSDMSYNPAANIAKGYKLTNRKNPAQEYVSALAGGGLIRFGTMLEGNEASRTRQLIKQGAKDEHILDDENKMRAFYDKWIEPTITAYNELGNRGEEVNRMALYDQMVKNGVGHAEASLAARDLMDFSMQGSWKTVRFLSQLVPFMNARIQGMYKLGRAAKQDKARFAIVLGATSMASLALLAMYGDDDDWKKREDWDRDNYWWFKIGGIAYRIPKPFEIGAIATLAERTAELMFDDEMNGKRFRDVTTSLVANQLAMNPIPQTFKPLIDLYANTDSFTKRPIEPMGLERVDPSERYTQRTSMIARGVSSVGNAVTGESFLSPIQIDFLVKSYFGWMGATAVSSADMLVRSVSNGPTKPSIDQWKLATGGMVSELSSAQSRYISMMYDQAAELEQAHATYNRLRKEGKIKEATEYRAKNKDKLGKYKRTEAVKKSIRTLNERAKMIERSNKDPDEKKALINQIRAKQDEIARTLYR